MLNRIVLAIALALLSFQLLFSVYYSSKIVAHNRKYSQLEKEYAELKSENQKLEIEFVNKYAINGNITF
jgi:cell division protein FtsB